MNRLTPIALPFVVLAITATAHPAEIISSERAVTVDVFALDGYFDDADIDGDSIVSFVAGFFEEELNVTATGTGAAVTARAEQTSDLDIASGAFEAFGFAAGSLYIQGIGDTTAESAFRTTFDIAVSGGVTFDQISLVVDDVLDGTDAHDRPGDATASIRIVREIDGAVVYEQALALDDAGTPAEILIEDPVDVALTAGRYDLAISAVATDTTGGINEVEFSVATAEYEVFGRIWEACPGDADHNEQVDVDDVLAVVLDFGYIGLDAPHRGDVDGSGAVDIDDMTYVILHFGQRCEQMTFYEPDLAFVHHDGFTNWVSAVAPGFLALK